MGNSQKKEYIDNSQNEIVQDVQYLEQQTENIISSTLRWEAWEIITHIAVVVLFIYVAYLFAVSPEQRTLTNSLLLLIALAVAVQIHQNINIQRGLMGDSN